MFWDAKQIAHDCVIDGCLRPATVIVVDPTGEEHGPHCGPHADARINSENAPLYKALREAEAERLAAEAAAAEGVTT